MIRVTFSWISSKYCWVFKIDKIHMIIIDHRHHCDIRSIAIFNSAISISIAFLSISSTVYFNSRSHASVSADMMSFLSRQRLWYPSINEYVTFFLLVLFSLFPSLQWLHVFALTLKGTSESTIFILNN
jgi:hypothetical protein